MSLICVTVRLSKRREKVTLRLQLLAKGAIL